MRKKPNDTKRYARPSRSQTVGENGETNIKRLGGTGLGFLYNMEIPKFINCNVKSTALSRSEVIVRSAIARSAFCWNKH